MTPLHAGALAALVAFGGTEGVPRYALVARFSSDMRSVSVTGEMHVPRSLVRHDTLELRLSKLFRGLRITEARGRTLSVTPIGDTTANVRHYRVLVPNPGDTTRLRFEYSGGNGIAFGYALDGEAAFAAAILTAWYPLLDRQDTWVPVRGTGHVQFVVPDSLTVVASGVRRDASTYDFTVPSFFSYSIARYIRTVHDGPIRVTFYTLRERPDTRAHAARASAVLDTLQRVFGKYPYTEFAMAETPLRQSRAARFNGVSLEGAMFGSTALIDAPFNTAFFGHELSHQWWGVLVNPIGTPGDQLLSEGMAQFGALRAVQLAEGDSSARLFRTWGYPGFTRDHSAFGYVKLAVAGLDTPLVKISGDPLSTQLVWSKAFLLYDLLAREVGEDSFRLTLQRLLRTHAFNTMEWRDFTNAFAQQSTLIERWFGTAGSEELERTLALPPGLRAQALALINVTRGEMARRAGALDDAERWFAAAVEEAAVPDSVAAEFAGRYGLGRIALLRGDTVTARTRFEQALAAPARNIEAVGGIYLELARLAAVSGDTARLRRLVDAVRTAEAVANTRGSGIERAALDLLRTTPRREEPPLMRY
jgi:hypothetical protein